jgi:5-(carboxyamino)imidazole ribonucleotide mutase/phosphoribosylaminoimidazole-succinocarboxamide synthase
MTTPFAPIIMGSKADLEHGREIAAGLATFGIDTEIRVASAHKATRYLMDLLAVYEADPRPKVYITVAGRSNALSAVVDANALAPVIACPPYSDRFGGADVFSTLRMPSGLAPALVMEPRDAAVLAAKILSLSVPRLREAIEALHRLNEDRVIADDHEVVRQAKG